MASDATDESNLADGETVPATSYVTPTLYQHWQDEAENRNQSVSKFISTMVESGLNQISLENGSTHEIIELRQEIQEIRSERNELRRKLEGTQQQDYQVGLGRIKDLIINNPGIDRREITNNVSENTHKFVNNYLECLEDSEFRNDDGRWYPPENMGDN